MSRSFDKILVRRVREVFDNHREAVDPDAWKDMEKRLNQRGRLRVVYVGRIAGVAALLLLLFLVFRPFDSLRDTVPSRDQMVESQLGPSSSSSGTGGDSSGGIEGTASDHGENTEPGAIADQQDRKDRQAKKDDKERKEPEDRKRPEDWKNWMAGDIPEAYEEKTSVRAYSGELEDMAHRGKMQKEQPLTTGVAFSPSPAGSGNNRLAKAAREPGIAPVRSERTLHSGRWDDLVPQPASPEKKNPMELGVEFSTLYNYASSMIGSEVNFAGGVVSEFKILPNLKLNTGLVVSRQYFTTRKRSPNLTAYLSKNTGMSSSSELHFYDGRADFFNDLSNKVMLVGLDVPVNIEYQAGNISLSAGISSFTYLQEKYRHEFTGNYIVYEYDDANNVVGSDNITRSESVEEAYSPLGKIDLASVLNVAVGYHVDMEKSRLVVEPFMKHPLSDLASRDIRFGAMGIRLRVGF